MTDSASPAEKLRHIRDIASGDGGDDASRSDPHNALATIVVLCDEALASVDDERPTPVGGIEQYQAEDR